MLCLLQLLDLCLDQSILVEQVANLGYILAMIVLIFIISMVHSVEEHLASFPVRGASRRHHQLTNFSIWFLNHLDFFLWSLVLGLDSHLLELRLCSWLFSGFLN